MSSNAIEEHFCLILGKSKIQQKWSCNSSTKELNIIRNIVQKSHPKDTNTWLAECKNAENNIWMGILIGWK